MMNDHQKLLIRWLRSHGLQQAEIARVAGLKSHQVVGYQTRKLRDAFLDKHNPLPSLRAGVEFPLVGFASGPCPPSLDCCWCKRHEYGSADPNHSCPSYVKSAAYAQMEDLDKSQKLGVILALLEEVESE